MIDAITTDQIDTESSKLITHAEYNSLYHRLKLTFKTNGKIYEYKGVSEDIWQQFKSSESKGKFFHAYIKNMYKFEKNL